MGSITNEQLESACIVAVGMYMHLKGISAMELKYSKLPSLVPNLPSTIFVFSILCILTQLRPLWPTSLRRPQKFLYLLVETTIILVGSELVLRQIWIPILKCLNFICDFAGQYVIVANDNFSKNGAPHISNWMSREAFYIARCVLAVLSFLFMTQVTGATKNWKTWFGLSSCPNEEIYFFENGESVTFGDLLDYAQNYLIDMDSGDSSSGDGVRRRN